jgi:predicted porin
MNRQLLAAVVSGALVLPMAAQGVEIAASGHINRALVFSDLKGSDDPKHADAASSGSRFRFSGTEDLENGITAGVNLEYGAGGAGGDNPSVRHANVSLGGAFGTLTVGQTAPATNVIGYNSFDNYAWLSGTEIGCDFCGAASGASSTVFTSFGAGRMQVVKLALPALGPANLSFSADGNDFWDVAMRASGEAGDLSYTVHAGYGQFASTAAGLPTDVYDAGAFPATMTDAQVKAALGPTHALTSYTEDADGEYVVAQAGDTITAQEVNKGTGAAQTHVKTHYMDDYGAHKLYTPAAAGTPEYNATTLSTAVMFGQGTHFNVTWAQKDPDTGANSEITHVGVGHNFENTSVAVTWTSSDTGGGGESWGIGVGHGMGSVELYAGYKNLEHDSALAEDYGLFVVGSRIMFN